MRERTGEEEKKKFLRCDFVVNETDLPYCSLRDTIKDCNSFLIKSEHWSLLK